MEIPWSIKASDYIKAWENELRLPDHQTILCPICDELSNWNSYFQRYMCSNKECNKSITLNEYELWDEYNKQK